MLWSVLWTLCGLTLLSYNGLVLTNLCTMLLSSPCSVGRRIFIWPLLKHRIITDVSHSIYTALLWNNHLGPHQQLTIKLRSLNKRNMCTSLWWDTYLNCSFYNTECYTSISHCVHCSRIHTYDLSLKILQTFLIPCTALVSNWILLSSNFTRATSN